MLANIIHVTLSPGVANSIANDAAKGYHTSGN
jgi:hypothetical protein